MLPRKNRLKKKKDFEKIIKRGKGASNYFLSVRFLPTELTASRIGFVVSKKVSNRAILRNRIKRRLRESIKANLPRIATGYDMIFFARPEIADKDYKQIYSAVLELLTKTRLIN